MCRAKTTSNDPGSKGGSPASPCWTSIAEPNGAALPCASRTISVERSTPRTWCPISAISTLIVPVPQARSATSDGVVGSQVRSRSFHAERVSESSSPWSG